MPHTASLRHRLALSAGAASLLAALSLVPLAAGTASAATAVVPTLQCPQAVAAATLPIFTPSLGTPKGSVTLASGSLPAGMSIQAAESALIGFAAKAEKATFVLQATGTKSDGSPDVITKECTITVHEAPVVQRVAGADRYQQALKVSQKTFTTADTVFIASGEKYSDALSATAIAAANGGPLLLTPPASLPSGLGAELTRLGAKNVVIVGGEASVSASVKDQVDAVTDATITRIGGADRYEVSRNLITDETFGVSDSDIYIATGSTFPDALTASPAAVTVDAPVLLVNGAEKELTPDESAVLTGNSVENVFIAGGPASVSDALEKSLTKSFTVTRFGGEDRFQVGVNINKHAFAAASNVYLASGLVFPDALSGGVAAATEGSPLYVTPSTCIDDDVLYDLGRLAPDHVTILGGENTLTPDVASLTTCGFE